MGYKVADEVYARQIAKHNTAWQELKRAVKTIKITCQDSKVEALNQHLFNIGLMNPELYVRRVSDGSHGVKIDTIVYTDRISRDTILKLYLGKRGGTDLNTYKQEPGTAQIGARYIAERLIQAGIKPRSLAERGAEKAIVVPVEAPVSQHYQHGYNY